jgi:hypothetical protein
LPLWTDEKSFINSTGLAQVEPPVRCRARVLHELEMRCPCLPLSFWQGAAGSDFAQFDSPLAACLSGSAQPKLCKDVRRIKEQSSVSRVGYR